MVQKKSKSGCFPFLNVYSSQRLAKRVKGEKMKTSNKISLIAGLSAIALIGTGYAAWTFSKDSTVNFDGSVNITAKAEEVGTLSVVPNQKVCLILDQDFIGWKDSTDENAAEVTSINLEYAGAVSKDVDEHITVSVDANYDSVLAKYVSFTAIGEQTKEYKGEDKLAFEFALPTISWVDGKKPLNEKAYDEMVAALGSSTVSFTFSAEVSECTHS